MFVDWKGCLNSRFCTKSAIDLSYKYQICTIFGEIWETSNDRRDIYLTREVLRDRRDETNPWRDISWARREGFLAKSRFYVQ
jgi:hypothetical protein